MKRLMLVVTALIGLQAMAGCTFNASGANPAPAPSATNNGSTGNGGNSSGT